MNRESPYTEYEDVPGYYLNNDIPHVLARVRFMERFFGEVVDGDEVARHREPDLYDAYLDMLTRDLAPYAAALAFSLIRLEDEVAGKHQAPPREEQV